MSAMTVSLGATAAVAPLARARAASSRAATIRASLPRSSAPGRVASVSSRAGASISRTTGRSCSRVASRAGEDDLPGPLDGLADGVDLAAVKAAVNGEDGEEVDVLEVENVPPMQFLVSSCAFYALMGVGSQVAASYLGVHPDIFDAMRDVNVDQGSLWSLPLLASLAFAITQADRFEFLGEVRDIFKVGVLPSLAPLGLPGVMALSLGAGVGEEAFFRGFLMPFADGTLTNIGVPEQLASVGVLTATSVFFGALHAITPAYFYWATGAGFLFGLEYLNEGLGTAAFTHTMYDFLAFGFILISWPIEGYEKETPFSSK